MDFNDPIFNLSREFGKKFSTLTAAEKAMSSLTGLTSMMNSDYYKMAVASTKQLDFMNPTLDLIAKSLAHQLPYDNNKHLMSLITAPAINLATKSLLIQNNLNQNKFNNVFSLISPSIEFFGKYDWQKNYPNYAVLNTNIANVLAGKLDFTKNLNLRFPEIDNLSVADSITVALNLDLENAKSNSQQNKIKADATIILEKANKFFSEVENIDENETFNLFEKIDEFFASKNVQLVLISLAAVIMPKLLILLIVQPRNINYNNVINDIEDADEIKVGVIYSSKNIIKIKNDRNNNSATLLELEVGSNFKILRSFRTWHYVRVMVGNEYLTGFVQL